jgi:hypothetical protein
MQYCHEHRQCTHHSLTRTHSLALTHLHSHTHTPARTHTHARTPGILGRPDNDTWAQIAQRIPIPEDPTLDIHLPWDNYNGSWGGLPVLMLGFPAMIPMTDRRRRADVLYYAGARTEETYAPKGMTSTQLHHTLANGSGEVCSSMGTLAHTLCTRWLSASLSPPPPPHTHLSFCQNQCKFALYSYIR